MIVRASLWVALVLVIGVLAGCSGPEPPKRAKGGKTTFVPPTVSVNV